MRIESSVTAISWIPSEAVEGLPKIPFTMGMAHYDDPPPDEIEDLDAMREADLFREANELKAFVEFGDDGSVQGYGHMGRGHIGVTRVKLGPKELSVAAVALPVRHRPGRMTPRPRSRACRRGVPSTSSASPLTTRPTRSPT